MKKYDGLDFFGRGVYSLSIRDFKGLSTLNMPSKYFTVFVALDSTNVNGEELEKFFANLITQGSVYICTWGPQCDDAESGADSAVVERDLRDGKERPVIMTTSHSHEELEEALSFFTENVAPHDAYFDECKCSLAISVGNDEWEKKISNYLSNRESGKTTNG